MPCCSRPTGGPAEVLGPRTHLQVDYQIETGNKILSDFVLKCEFPSQKECEEFLVECGRTGSKKLFADMVNGEFRDARTCLEMFDYECFKGLYEAASVARGLTSEELGDNNAVASELEAMVKRDARQWADPAPPLRSEFR